MVPGEKGTTVVNREGEAPATNAQTKVNVEENEPKQEAQNVEPQEEENTPEETPESAYYKKYFSQSEETKPEVKQSQNSTEQTIRELKEAVLNATVSGTKAEKEEAKRNFRQYIADADFEGAEAYLLKRQEAAFMQKVQDLEKKMTDQVADATRRAVEQATSASAAKISIQTYIDGIIPVGSELSEWRDYIQSESDRMVMNSRNSGRIETIDDYVEAKKAAVQHVANTLSKRLGLVKGKAKTSAKTRKQEVLAAEGVSPGSNRDGSDLDAAKNEPPQDQSVSDYVAGRQKLAAKLRGFD